MLASLKRRLLRTSHPAPAGGGALPPPPPPQPTPPQPPPPPQPSPRHHVDLRGQLAALHLQFAALPPPRANQHSAEVLQALEALKARFPPADGDAVARPPPPLAAPLPPPRKRAARSPQRRMNRSATLPAARPAAGRRPAWRDPTVEREAGGAGESSEPAEAPPQPVAAAAPAETSGAGPSAAARPKLAALKRRQSRPSDAHPGPSPAAPLLPGDGEANGHWTAEARRTASGGGAELSAALTSMPARPRCYLASRITPRVLAAAAERAPAPASSLPPSGDPLAPESGRPDTGLWRRTISSGGGSRRGSLTGGDSDLWAGLAPAVSRATTPAAQGGASPLVPAAGCSRRGISQPELEWRGQGQQARPATREGGAQAEAAAAGGGQAGRLQAAAASASPSGTVQLQRLPRHELPADLLSLQESASLARQSQVGHPPRPPPRRVQRKAASAQEEPVAEAPAVAAVAAADPGAAPGTRAAQRVAALRGQRRGGWQSDFPAAVPSWRFSQEEEPSGALPPLAAQPPAGHSPAAAATAAAQTTQRASPHPAQLPPAPSPGLTHAQRRQQEAWGSLAGVCWQEVGVRLAEGLGCWRRLLRDCSSPLPQSCRHEPGAGAEAAGAGD